MGKRFRDLNAGFLNMPTLLRGAIVVLLTCVVAAIDILMPSYISFLGYYLIPIFLSIWYFSCRRIFALVFFISLLSRLYVAEFVVPSGRPLWEGVLSFGSIVLALSIFSGLVFVLKRYALQAVENSEKDSLTGLKNRRGFLCLAEYEMSRRNRVRYPLTVAMMDVDCFKMLNDTQGHDAGDKLLVEFAETLRTSLRNVDIIGRMGGDEFAVVLPNTDLKQTNLVIERLFSHLRPMLQSFGCSELGCSLGAVNVKAETCGAEIHELLKQADALMYKVKHTTKNDFLVEAI